MKNLNFLIIAGTPKAGTTSVFDWLRTHPSVTASTVKETRFFLDPGYPMPSSRRYNGHNLLDYLHYFPGHEQGKVLLESTPDYLYNNQPLTLAEKLPNARVIFIIRDPVDRAVSWYRFAAQLGYLKKGTTFEQYIQAQLELTVSQSTPIYLRALEQNRLRKYLPRFQNAFGDRCLVLPFEAIQNDPLSTCQTICEFANIERSFFSNHKFEAKNVTTGAYASTKVRWYYRARAWLLYNVRPSEKTMNRLRPAAKALKLVLAGNQTLPKINVSDELRKIIIDDAERT